MYEQNEEIEKECKKLNKYTDFFLPGYLKKLHIVNNKYINKWVITQI